MLKGDLATTGFGAVISDLSTSGAIGCLHVEGPDGDEALVYFKSGLIYSAFLPGRRPQLGARLISSGALAPEALEEALEAQATELQGWRLGELLVHLGFVEAEVVEAFSVEQVRDSCFEMSRWPSGTWKFRKNEKTREDIAAAVDVPGVLEEITRRDQDWAVVLDVIRTIDSVPVLGAGGLASAEMALDQDEWALLCKVDGERNIHQLARDCGFTDFEAGQIVSSLVTTGLLEMEPAAPESADDDPANDDQAPAMSPRSAAARLMAAFGGGDDMETDFSDESVLVSYGSDDADLAMPSYLSSLVLPLVADEAEEFDESSVGSELTRLMSFRDDLDVIDDVVVEERPADEGAASEESGDGRTYTAYELPPLDPDAFADEPYADPDASLPRYSVGFGHRNGFDESLSAVSKALSALLGSQPSEAISMFNPEYLPPDESEDEHRSRVIREAAAAEMSAAHQEMEEQRRRFEDARKRADESQAAEIAEQQEQLAAEQARLVAEQEEREAAEEAERLAAAEETERLAAEETERLAAEEAERLAAQEAAHLVAEEARRIAADEEAARVAAAEVALAEAEAARLAAEEESARLAAQREVARVAAEEEVALLAVQHEAARIAAEEAAQRLAAQHEDARLTAEEEEARLVSEQLAEMVVAAQEEMRVAAEAEAVRLVAEEEAAAIRLADEEAAAARLAEEEATAAALAAQQAADALRELEETPPPPPPPPAPAPPAPASAPVMTDTASLMRELSSLGFEDEPTPAPSRPSTSVGAGSRPSGGQSDKGKKRKGLFGRG
ncbi:MAG: DUF4388 domain-containing protein [Actinomycetota bacterium]